MFEAIGINNTVQESVQSVILEDSGQLYETSIIIMFQSLVEPYVLCHHYLYFTLQIFTEHFAFNFPGS